MQLPLLPAVIMGTLALGLSVFAFHQSPALAWTGLRNGGSLLLGVLPIIVAAVVVSGLVQVFLPREFVAGWLGSEAGWKGIAIAWLMGSIMPGPPYVVFPLAAGIYKAGAGVGPMVTYMTAWSLIQFTRVPMEMAFLGPKFTFIRLGSIVIFPPLAGLIAQQVYGRLTTP